MSREATLLGLIKHFIFLIIIFVFFSIEPAKAQLDTITPDTKGKDFWLTFLPNFHNGKIDPSEYYDDSLYIFITADKPTTGEIDYCDLSGKTYTQNFSLPDPTKIYSFELFYNNFELLGYNDNSGSISHRNNSEVVTKQYYHIITDNEVSVIAHDQSNTTGDACLVFPTDILGKDYFIMSYKSDGSYGSYGLDVSSTPSQFVVLATEDSTNITILPKDYTEYNGKNEQSIIMDKGDAYLVQAEISKDNLNSDLTGSEIQSSKPVAVFAGHQRANIPINPDGSTSRDYLLEEMPPIQTWGKNALLVPYVQPPSINPWGTDLFRILAANDNTQVFINGTLTATLNKGKFYEGALTQAGNVTANAPILVSQFKKTSGFGSGVQTSPLSDPFEMLIPPVEQFMMSYRFINLQAYEYNTLNSNYEKVYTKQYITIVAPDTSLQSILLDSVNVPVDSFNLIPSSDFDYANIMVGDGVHTINCNANVGVYVYGYGPANSYGYFAGMKMEPINITGIIKESEPNYLKDLLEQAFPNPASDNVKFRFRMSKQENTILKIYDILGNERSIVVSEKLNEGNYEYNFDTSMLPQGIYIYVLTTGNQKQSRLMTIIR
jgi:hypothetical protein